MNVTTTFVPIYWVSSWNCNLEKDNLEILLDVYSCIYNTSSLTNGYIRKFGMLVAIVPIIDESKVDLSIQIFASLFGIIAVLFTALIVVKYSRNPSLELSFLLIFRLMIG